MVPDGIFEDAWIGTITMQYRYIETGLNLLCNLEVLLDDENIMDAGDCLGCNESNVACSDDNYLHFGAITTRIRFKPCLVWTGGSTSKFAEFPLTFWQHINRSLT